MSLDHSQSKENSTKIAAIVFAGPDVFDIDGTWAELKHFDRYWIVARDVSVKTQLDELQFENVHCLSPEYPLAQGLHSCPDSIFDEISRDTDLTWLLLLEANERMGEKFRAELFEQTQKNKVLGFRFLIQRLQVGIYTKKKFGSQRERRLFNLRPHSQGNLDNNQIDQRRELLGRWTEESSRNFKNSKSKTSIDPSDEEYDWPQFEHSLIDLGHRYISDQLRSMNRQTNWVEGNSQRCQPLKWCRQSLGIFWKTYFSKKGYSEGMPGLVASTLRSFERFLSSLKAWEKGKTSTTED